MKTLNDIKGIICAMVTPMNADESVNLAGVKQQTCLLNNHPVPVMAETAERIYSALFEN